jgi:hypothetical protein
METPRFCELCNRTGLVTVYHPLDVRAVREGCEGFRHFNGTIVRAGVNDHGLPINAFAAVPCKCKLGDKNALWFDPKEKREPERLPRFGESVNHVKPSELPLKPGCFIEDVERAMQPVEWEF